MNPPQTLTPLHLIATDEAPLRASAAGNLDCLLRAVLTIMQDEHKPKSEAANTGTLCHTGIETWIKGSSLDASVAAMEARQVDFREARETLGDLKAATRWLEAYSADPRNAPLGVKPANPIHGIVRHVEAKVGLRIPASKDLDPTGRDVCVIGTLDQIREDDLGQLWLWDIKTGQIDPQKFAPVQHLVQLVIYAAGASQMLGRPVGIGGVIAVRGYHARNEDRQGVFRRVPIPHSTFPLVLEAIAERVGMLRQGIVSPTIGKHCDSCFVSLGGPSECLPKLLEWTGRQR